MVLSLLQKNVFFYSFPEEVLLTQYHLQSFVFLCGFSQVTFISPPYLQQRQGNYAVCESWVRWVGWRHGAWGRLLVCASDARRNVFCGRLTAEMSYCFCTDRYWEFIAEAFGRKLRIVFIFMEIDVRHHMISLTRFQTTHHPCVCECVWCQVAHYHFHCVFGCSSLLCVINMNAKLKTRKMCNRMS